MFVLCFVIHCFVTHLVCNYLDGNERAGCFVLFVLLVSCDCYVAHPCGAVGWSVVSDILLHVV